MALLVKDLTAIDYEILEFVERNQPVDIETLRKAFKTTSALDYRIELLSTAELRDTGPIAFPIDNTYFLEEEYDQANNVYRALGVYTLTDFAKKALQDHKREVKRHNWELWLKFAWIPILVSLATNLVLIELRPLLSRLIQWITHSL